MTSKTTTSTTISSLLNQIDDGINFDNLEWNKSTYQTLLVCFIRLKLFVFCLDNLYRFF